MTEKEIYNRDLVFEEAVGYIMRRRKDLDLYEELALGIFSVWNLSTYMRNSLSIGTERRFDVFYDDMPMDFSAHAHPNEPLLPSPDDLAVVSTMTADSYHFVTDGFRCARYY